jgi:hypothetical protein
MSAAGDKLSLTVGLELDPGSGQKLSAQAREVIAEAQRNIPQLQTGGAGGGQRGGGGGGVSAPAAPMPQPGGGGTYNNVSGSAAAQGAGAGAAFDRNAWAMQYRQDWMAQARSMPGTQTPSQPMIPTTAMINRAEREFYDQQRQRGAAQGQSIRADEAMRGRELRERAEFYSGESDQSRAMRGKELRGRAEFYSDQSDQSREARGRELRGRAEFYSNQSDQSREAVGSEKRDRAEHWADKFQGEAESAGREKRGRAEGWASKFREDEESKGARIRSRAEGWADKFQKDEDTRGAQIRQRAEGWAQRFRQDEETRGARIRERAEGHAAAFAQQESDQQTFERDQVRYAEQQRQSSLRLRMSQRYFRSSKARVLEEEAEQHPEGSPERMDLQARANEMRQGGYGRRLGMQALFAAWEISRDIDRAQQYTAAISNPFMTTAQKLQAKESFTQGVSGGLGGAIAISGLELASQLGLPSNIYQNFQSRQIDIAHQQGKEAILGAKVQDAQTARENFMAIQGMRQQERVEGTAGVAKTFQSIIANTAGAQLAHASQRATLADKLSEAIQAGDLGKEISARHALESYDKDDLATRRAITSLGEAQQAGVRRQLELGAQSQLMRISGESFRADQLELDQKLDVRRDASGKIIGFGETRPGDLNFEAIQRAYDAQSKQLGVNEERRGVLASAAHAATIARLADNPLQAQLTEIKGNFEAATKGMIPGSEDYEREKQKYLDNTSEATHQYDNQTKLISIGLQTRGDQLTTLLGTGSPSSRQIAAESIGLRGAALSQAEQLRQSGRKEQAADALRNGVGEQRLLKAEYVDSFRAVQFDAATNLVSPRDKGDIGEDMKSIKENTEKIESALHELGFEK